MNAADPPWTDMLTLENQFEVCKKTKVASHEMTRDHLLQLLNGSRIDQFFLRQKSSELKSQCDVLK